MTKDARGREVDDAVQDALTEVDAAFVPDRFEVVWGRAGRRAARGRAVRRSAAGMSAAVLVGWVAFVADVGSRSEPEVLPEAWASMSTLTLSTDFLLDTPGRAFLGQTPAYLSPSDITIEPLEDES